MEAMNFDSVKEAVILFEDCATKRALALQEGKSKIANRNFDKLVLIAKYLREQKALCELARFYEHPIIGVRITVAAYLLPIYEKKSISVLKEIVKMKVVGSFDAEMLIKEWEKGNLQDFYTV